MNQAIILQSKNLTKEAMELLQLNKGSMFEYPNESIRLFTKDSRTDFYLMYNQQDLIGLGLKYKFEGIDLVTGCIHPFWLRKGYGSELFVQLFSNPMHTFVQVLKNNIVALNFLFSIGLRVLENSTNTYFMGAN